MNNLQIKYTERMGRILESSLKVLDRSQAPRTGNETGPETGMDEDPVPGFFVNSDSSWISRSEDSPDTDIDLMNPEFIVYGLEELMNYLPDPTYSEYMPGPDEPIQETEQPRRAPESNPVVTLAGVDGPVEPGRSVTRDSTEDLLHPATTTTNQYLNTPQNHPVSDSGIGSNMGSPCRGLSFNGAVNDNSNSIGNVELDSVHAEAGTATATESIQETSVPIQSQLASDLSQSFVGHLEELTPPNSAHLTPSSFLPRESSQFQQKIQAYILNPMSQDLSLREFWSLCRLANGEMQQGKINCLRDLEKFFLYKGNVCFGHPVLLPSCGLVVLTLLLGDEELVRVVPKVL